MIMWINTLIRMALPHKILTPVLFESFIYQITSTLSLHPSDLAYLLITS